MSNEILDAVCAELSGFGEPLASSSLAATARALAGRLDAAPQDREAVLLARELRLVMVDLRERSKGGDSELEAFLQRISAPELGYGKD